MPQPLYPQYRTWYTLNWNLGGSQEPVCMFWRKKLLSLLGFEPQAVQSQSSDSNYTVLELGVKAKYMYLLDYLC